MRWRDDILHGIRQLYTKEEYAKWNEAIRNGEIAEFSENLDGLLGRLANILVSEFKLNYDPNADEKLKKILQLAAIGGKIL